MMHAAPTKSQKDWREIVRETGSIISGEPAVIHHPAGRKAKHNKQPIGHYWLLPLADHEHKLLHFSHMEFERLAFGFSLVGRWDAEKILFRQVIEKLPGWYEFIPEPIMNAILDYRR